MKRVVIVPGHSYKDPGAVNESLGITEYEYCLNRTLELLKGDTWDDIDVVLKRRNRSYSELPKEIDSLNPNYRTSPKCS